MKLLNTILDLIFPTKCINCGKLGESICEKCLSGVQKNQNETEKWIFSATSYKDPVIKKAIRLFKYKKKKKLGEPLAQIIYDQILEELEDLRIFENFTDFILIPIPISKKRRKERGYNQTEILAEKIVSFNPKIFKTEKDVLFKNNKDTKHQADIKNKKERLINPIGSFGVRNIEKIKKKNIILIDDVLTTGATLKEAKKVLKDAGAKKIIAFTIAH